MRESTRAVIRSRTHTDRYRRFKNSFFHEMGHADTNQDSLISVKTAKWVITFAQKDAAMQGNSTRSGALLLPGHYQQKQD